MGDNDFETVTAVALEDPVNIGMMASSTPTGRRGKFYDICTRIKFNQDDIVKPINTKELGYVYDTRKYDRSESYGWKEFYFPTYVNPNWSPKMEKELREQYSEVGYQHEVLAEFGTETVGVYNKDYVDEAASIEYPLEPKRIKGGPIAIGVDWDKLLTNIRKKILTLSNMSPLGVNLLKNWVNSWKPLTYKDEGNHEPTYLGISKRCND